MRKRLLTYVLLTLTLGLSSTYSEVEAQQTNRSVISGKARAKAQAESIERWLKSNGYNPSLYRDDEEYRLEFKSKGYDISAIVETDRNAVAILIFYPITSEANYWAGLYANDAVARRTLISSWYTLDEQNNPNGIYHGCHVIGLPTSISGEFIESAIEGLHYASEVWGEAYKEGVSFLNKDAQETKTSTVI